jgi:hypothetical protein
MLATIRRKLALNDFMRKRAENIGKELDLTTTSRHRLDLSKVKPGFATINLAYEPFPPLSRVERQIAEDTYNPQSLVDDLNMYEGDMDGCAKLDDFDRWIEASYLNLLPHERKFIIKNFKAHKSPHNVNEDPYDGYRDDNVVQVDFKLFAAALQHREVIAVGDVVECKFRRRDRWFLAKVLRITNVENVDPETSEPVYDVQYVELGLDGVMRVPKHPVRRSDENERDEDGQTYDNSGDLVPIATEGEALLLPSNYVLI